MDNNCIILVPYKKENLVVFELNSEHSLSRVIRDLLCMYSSRDICWNGTDIQSVINNHISLVKGTSKLDNDYRGKNIVHIFGNLQASLPKDCYSSNETFSFVVLEDKSQ